jgi:hypothetical protein
VAAAGLLATGLGLAAGCANHSHVADRRLPVRVDGPGVVGLSATAGDGGQSIYPPHAAPHRWVGTAGSFVLCTRGRYAPARILDVRARVTPGKDPVAVTFWLRTVTRAAVAATPPRRRTGYEPVGSALGAPPRWDQPYRDAVYPGDYSRGLRGLVVHESCAATQAAWARIDHHRVPATGFRELMVTLAVDDRGGQVRGVDITYEQDGERAILRTTWSITACGTAVRDRRFCPRVPRVAP